MDIIDECIYVYVEEVEDIGTEEDKVVDVTE
jgi:hypothetical protein